MVLEDKTLDPSSFMVFLGLAYNILTPFKAISKASYKVRKGNAAAERVIQILENKSIVSDPKNNKVISQFDKSIQFNNISFSYKTDKVIKEFSFELEKGKTLALVGQSGSGKSTLINETLYPILNQYFYKSVKTPLPFEKIKGIKKIEVTSKFMTFEQRQNALAELITDMEIYHLNGLKN